MRFVRIVAVVVLVVACSSSGKQLKDVPDLPYLDADQVDSREIAELTTTDSDWADVPAPDNHDAMMDLVLPDLGAEMTVPDVDVLGTDEGFEIPCEPPELPAVTGLVYLDGDQSSTSSHAQGLFPAYDSPLNGVPVVLHGSATVSSTESCGDGTFSFGPLNDGIYVVEVVPLAGADATSNNLPRRFPEALDEGGMIVMVTIGDSIPVDGDEIPFPDRVQQMFSPLVAIDNRNLAVPGSTSTSWLPESSYFQTKLVPELADADLVVISLGGNDLSAFLPFGPVDMEYILSKLDEFPAYMADVTANIVSTIEEIRLIAPEVDIVYCLYPNYANSALWKQFAGSYANLLVSGLTNVLKDIRRDFAKVPDILIMDMFGTFGDESLDDYLFDMVHFNNTGHQRCAEELFQLLGGTRVGPEPLGTEHSYGLFFAQP